MIAATGEQGLLAGIDHALERGTDGAELVRAYVDSDVGKVLASEAPY